MLLVILLAQDIGYGQQVSEQLVEEVCAPLLSRGVVHATCGQHHRHLSTAKPTASPVPVFRRLAADDGSLPGSKQTKGGVSTGEGRACERDTGDPTTVTSRVIQRDNGEFCWPANLILSGSGGGPQAKICHLSRRLGFQALVLAQDGRVLPDRV